jgi:hypothetical protein
MTLPPRQDQLKYEKPAVENHIEERAVLVNITIVVNKAMIPELTQKKLMRECAVAHHPTDRHRAGFKVSATIDGLDRRFDLGKRRQLFRRVHSLGCGEIPAAEFQQRNQHAAFISQMFIEGEATQRGADHVTRLARIERIGGIETVQLRHLPFQRCPECLNQRQKGVQPYAAVGPFRGDMPIEG